MKLGTKLGLLSIAASLITTIAFGIVEVRDARNGRRKLKESDIELIAEKVALKQEEIRLAKRRAKNTVKKEEKV